MNEKNEISGREDCSVVIAGVYRQGDDQHAMDELEGLAEAAGARVMGRMIQNADKFNGATLMGSGKVRELAEFCSTMEADTVIFDQELTGIQMRNLEEALGVRVIDRTILILDIFASRAVSREGKLQVELAQLEYRLPRLLGLGRSLSRLGGGIGTRGPGEKKLETDRRHISRRMDEIKKELRHIGSVRKTQRARREKSEIPVAALVGYTNSGKSALMNCMLKMTEKGDKYVSSEDMLFATLDTSHRKIRADNGREFILVDTVGFVSRLPHTLVEAFKATLEEVVYADLLIHIVDVTRDDQDFCIRVTEEVLEEIGAGDKDSIFAYNKIDAAGASRDMEGSRNSVAVSARTGENTGILLSMITERLFADRVSVQLLIPYERGEVASFVCEKGNVSSIEHLEEGILIKAVLSEKDHSRVKRYDTL